MSRKHWILLRMNALIVGFVLTSCAQVTDVVKLLPRESLVVTHASSAFDPNHASKTAIDEEVAAFKQKGAPVVYLLHKDVRRGDPFERLLDPASTYFLADRFPTLAIHSGSGEIDLIPTGSKFRLVGGTFSGCLFRTTSDLIRNYFKNEKNTTALTIEYARRAIYIFRQQTTKSSTLIQEFSHGNDSSFYEYVRQVFMVAAEANTGDRPFSSSEYHFDVQLGNQPLGTFGDGTNKVSLVFDPA